MSAPDLQFQVLAQPDDDLGFLGCMRVDGNLIFAAGGTYHSPTVLASSDGTHFHERATPETPGLRHLLVLRRGSGADDEARVVLVGEYGGIWTSDDLGKTWVRRPVDDGAACLYALARDGSRRLWVGGDAGFITRSSDDGETWETLACPADGRFLAITHVAAEGGDRTFLYGDGLWVCEGDDFTQVDGPWEHPLTSLARTHTGTLLLVGDGGSIFRSTDQGKNWETVDVPTEADLEDLALVGPYAEEDGILIVGADGTVLYSNDDGSSFVIVDADTEAHLWSVASDGTGGFIGGDEGLVLRFQQPGDTTWDGRPDRFDEPGALDEVFLAVEPEAFLEDGLGRVVQPWPAAETVEATGYEDDEDDDEDDEEPEVSEIEQAARHAFEVLAGGGDASDFEAVWGQKEPAELTRLREILSAGTFDFHEWQPSLEVFPDPGDDENLFELLVLRDQQAYLGTGLSEAFCGLVYLGSLGNGDSYHFQAVDTPEENALRPVLFFNHETHDLEWIFANSLSTFTYLTALTGAKRARLVSSRAYREAFARLDGRVALSWHFSSDREKAGVELSEFEPEEQSARYYFYRSMWIVFLFRNDGVADVGTGFFDHLNAPMTDEQVELWTKGAKQWAPTALYLIWRCWFFKNEELAPFMDIARDHASRLVRDAARLIDELDAGRKSLGTIADMHALRDAVLALDVDPNRAADREREAAERREALERQRTDAFEKVAQAAAAGDDLAELAWHHLSDPFVQEAVAEALRKDAAMATTFAVVDWVESGGWSHDHLILDHELGEACELFSECADARIVPLLVSSIGAEASELDDTGDEDAEDEEPASDDDQPTIEAKPPRQWRHAGKLLAFFGRAHALDPRAAEAVRPLLDREEKYEHARTEVVRLLTAAADRACVEKCTELLRNKRLDEDFTADIRYGDLTEAIIRLLGTVDDPAGREALHWLLEQEDDEYVERRPLVLDSLAKLGDEGAVDAALQALEDAEDEAALPWALARIALSAGRQAEAVEAIRNKDADGDLQWDLAVAASLALCGQAPDGLAELIERGLTEPAYDGERTTEQQKWALQAAGFCEDVEAERLHAFVWRDDPNLRETAAEALERRGQDVPESKAYYRFILDELDDDALRAALRDPQSRYAYNAALELMRRECQAAREDIIGFARRYVALADSQSSDTEMSYDVAYPLRWAVKALRHLEPNDATLAFFNELLLHSNREIKDPVLRDPPQDAALIPGMLQVRSENWGWQASTAKEWLTGFKGTQAYERAVAARRAD